jgi:hypothetical protein
MKLPIYYLIICFKSCLGCTGKARYVSDTDILLFFCSFCLLLFWFKGPCSNVTVDQVGQTSLCSRAVVSPEIWHCDAQVQKCTERNCWVYGGCARTETWFERGFTVNLKPRSLSRLEDCAGCVCVCVCVCVVAGVGDWNTDETGWWLILACHTSL